MTDGEIRAAFLNLNRVMSNQAQAMLTQGNQEVAPGVNQNASTMCSHLRDYTRINPLIFFGYK